MQMITFVSFKGGAGKSTALMSAASVLVERGNRVAVLDADDNKPMLRWRKYADDLETWNDRCEVIEVRDFDAFEEVYQRSPLKTSTTSSWTRSSTRPSSTMPT